MGGSEGRLSQELTGPGCCVSAWGRCFREVSISSYELRPAHFASQMPLSLQGPEASGPLPCVLEPQSLERKVLADLLSYTHHFHRLRPVLWGWESGVSAPGHSEETAGPTGPTLLCLLLIQGLFQGPPPASRHRALGFQRGVGIAVAAWGVGQERGREQGCGQPVPFFLTHVPPPGSD